MLSGVSAMGASAAGARETSLGRRQWHVTANEASGTASSQDWRTLDTRQDTPPDAFRV